MGGDEHKGRTFKFSAASGVCLRLFAAKSNQV